MGKGIENDIIQVLNINSKGYGTIAKLAMRDSRLSISAKAIYAYFCSYAGAGRQAFPKVERIIEELQISKDTYYKHFNQLKKLGYIKAEQSRKNGKMTHNIYTLMDNISSYTDGNKRPSTKKQDTVICDAESLPSTKKQDTVIYDANIINSIYNKKDIDNLSLSSQSSLSSTVDDSKNNDRQDKTDKDLEAEQNISAFKNTDACLNTIKENITYSDFVKLKSPNIKLVDEIVAIIADTLMTNSETVIINKQLKPGELVRNYLLRLNYSDIEHVIEQFQNITYPIGDKRKYILSMLYNSKMENNSHSTNAFFSGYL